MKVHEQMTRSVVTTRPDAPLGQALGELEGAHLRCLPVVEDGRLVGLLLASNPALQDAPAAATVREYMQPPSASIQPGARIERAAVLMLEHDVRGLPVVDEHDQLLGVLTVSDLLDAIIKAPPVVLWP